MKNSIKAQVFHLLIALTSTTALVGMDDVRAEWGPIMCEEAIDEQLFYLAIHDGNQALVASMIDEKKIDPHNRIRYRIHCTHDHFAPENPLRPGDATYGLQTKVRLPIVIAVSENKIDIVKLLVETYNVKVNYPIERFGSGSTATPTAANSDNSPLLFCTKDPDMVTYLLAQGVNPRYKDIHHTRLESINNYLRAIISAQDPEILNKIKAFKKIKLLLEEALKTKNYPDPYATKEQGIIDSLATHPYEKDLGIKALQQTRLYQAISEGDTALIKEIIKTCQLDPNNQMSVHFYSTSGNRVLVTDNLVLTNLEKHQPSQIEWRSYMPLGVAIQKDRFDVVKFLIDEYKINVNATDHQEYSFLHLAIQKYNHDMVSYLIRHGADPLCKEHPTMNSGRTTLEHIDSLSRTLAAKDADQNILQKMESLTRMIDIIQPKSNTTTQTSLPSSSSSSSSSTRQIPISSSSSLLSSSSITSISSSPQTYSIDQLTEQDWVETQFYTMLNGSNMDWKAVHTFIQTKQLNPNNRMYYYYPKGGNSVWLLRDKNKYKNTPISRQEYWPIIIATLTYQDPIVRGLVTHWGCNVNQLDMKEGTPLQLATDHGAKELIKFLIAHGATQPTPQNSLSSTSQQLFGPEAFDESLLYKPKSQAVKELERELMPSGNNGEDTVQPTKKTKTTTTTTPTSGPKRNLDTPRNTRSLSFPLKTVSIAGTVIVCGLAIKWLYDRCSTTAQDADAQEGDAESTESSSTAQENV